MKMSKRKRRELQKINEFLKSRAKIQQLLDLLAEGVTVYVESIDGKERVNE